MIKRNIKLFFCLLSFTSALSQVPPLQWAKQIGASQFDVSTSLAVDASGNTYITGPFKGLIDFDPGPGSFTLSATLQDIFILKLDVAGNFVWAKQIAGAPTKISYGISLDGSGNVFVTGEYSGLTDFDPGPGTYTLNYVGSSPRTFILKLNPSGNFVWAGQIDGSAYNSGNGISCDAAGNVLVAGHFAGTADFDSSPGTYSITSFGSTFDDVFILKLDNAGNFIWVKQVGSFGMSDTGMSISSDVSGNVYSCGLFWGTADFDPGPGTFTYTSASSSYRDAFILKLNSSGNFIWAQQITGSGQTEALSLTVDGVSNSYTSLSFAGIVDVDPGPSVNNFTCSGVTDILILKLDPSGNFTYAKQIGGSGGDYPYKITLDPSNNIYTTGYFANAVDFDPGAGIYNLTSFGAGPNTYVSKLDPLGNFVWAAQMGGPGPSSVSCSGRSMAADATGKVYLTGTFFNTSDFDPGPGTFTFTSAGSQDVFILQLDQGPLGINTEEKNIVSLRIFPNPNNGLLNLSFNSTTKNTSIELYNELGQLVLKEKINSPQSKIDLSKFASGIYQLMILEDKITVRREKIIKQ